MKRIFILPFNTDLNRGDQALTWESIRLIQDVYKCNLEIFLIESGNTRSEVNDQISQSKQFDYKFCTPILKHPSRFFGDSKKKFSNNWIRIIMWGFVAFFDFLKSIPLLSKSDIIFKLGYKIQDKSAKETINNLAKSDCIVIKGGGFIHAYGKITDSYTLYYSIYSIFLAKRLKKKILMLPNSIGPIKGFIPYSLTKMLLSKCDFISVREHISKKYLLCRFRIESHYYPDLGYYLVNKSKISINDFYHNNYGITNEKIVGITLRPWRFPNTKHPSKKYSMYILSFVEFINYLIDNNFTICLFAHTLGPSAHENDLIAIKDVYDKISRKNHCKIIIRKDFNCADMMNLYSRCSYFIGTRFHSIIFCQNQNIPAIAVSYGGNKGIGIMEDLGLSQFVIPIENVSYEVLKSKFINLYILADEYKKIINEKKKIINEQREYLILSLSKIVCQ